MLNVNNIKYYINYAKLKLLNIIYNLNCNNIIVYT